jgi:hypothetical protein
MAVSSSVNNEDLAMAQVTYVDKKKKYCLAS